MMTQKRRPSSLTIGHYHWQLCDDGRYMLFDGYHGDRYQCGETESYLVEMLSRCEQEKTEIDRRSARDEHGLAVTCPASRHAELIADELIEHGSCPQLADEAKLCGESIRSAVRSLYRARAEIARLTAEVERHRMTDEEREAAERLCDAAGDMIAEDKRSGGCHWVDDEAAVAVVRGLLARTATRKEG